MERFPTTLLGVWNIHKKINNIKISAHFYTVLTEVDSIKRTWVWFVSYPYMFPNFGTNNKSNAKVVGYFLPFPKPCFTIWPRLSTVPRTLIICSIKTEVRTLWCTIVYCSKLIKLNFSVKTCVHIGTRWGRIYLILLLDHWSADP